jgi:trans-aconitate 2-methyltransferase
MTSLTWDPALYLGFAEERARPFADLVNRVAVPAPAHVVDLGCGPGNVTATLLDRWPGARVVASTRRRR